MKEVQNILSKNSFIDIKKIKDDFLYYHHETYLHSLRVARLCVLVASEMGVSEDGLQKICIAGLLHDIGKIEINPLILNKKDKLNKLEYEEIQTHVKKGVQILISYNIDSEIIRIVEEHHEKEDGFGYPYGKKGDEISLFGKILHVVDVFEALTGKRCYKPSIPIEGALNIIKKDAQSFDMEVVTILEKIMIRELE